MKLAVRQLETAQGQRVAVVPLPGRVDAAAASELRGTLQQVIEFGYPSLLVDLSAVTLLDSSGLGVLISALRKCKAAQGTLCLLAPSVSALQAIEAVSMDRVFTIFADESIAIANFPAI